MDIYVVVARALLRADLFASKLVLLPALKFSHTLNPTSQQVRCTEL